MLCLCLRTSARALTVDRMLGPPFVSSVCLCVGADALFIDGVVGVSQEDVGEAGLQQVHGQEGRLLHDLVDKKKHKITLRQLKWQNNTVAPPLEML